MVQYEIASEWLLILVTISFKVFKMGIGGMEAEGSGGCGWGAVGRERGVLIYYNYLKP